MNQRQSGMTVLELLITLLLAALVFGLALPEFIQMVANSRIRSELDALFHAVHLARKESIMRRSVVTLCPSADFVSCSEHWGNGWILFNNRDGDQPAVRDVDEPLLLVHRTHPSVKLAVNRQSFTLRATQKRATNGTVIVCDLAARVPPRALVVSYTGRPRVARLDRRGNPYVCPD
ncbi:MAG: GspH/FimT family protein [Pseudomonadota bacterium]